jgi:hypothetical protein
MDLLVLIELISIQWMLALLVTPSESW